MTINTITPYHVMNGNTEVFAGTHQECLRYELDAIDSIDLCTLPNNADDNIPYELMDEDLNYRYED